MILADLHVHSTFSDGKLTIAELVDFYGTLGFGCIAITDHICEEKSFLGIAASYLDYTLTASTWAAISKPFGMRRSVHERPMA